MRIAILCLCMSVTPSFADVSIDALVLPIGIDLGAKRLEFSEKLPNLEDSNSRSSISRYRQELERFNTFHIQGFREEINKVCETMNEFERRMNKAWSEGEISASDKRNFDQQILEERQKCQDRFYDESPYFKLYDEMINLYRAEAERSETVLSVCTSNDFCRGS